MGLVGREGGREVAKTTAIPLIRRKLAKNLKMAFGITLVSETISLDATFHLG